MFDVLVIGGGLSGSIAALVAKRAGARVALANRSWGATAMSTGALDLAYTPALSRTHQMPRTLAEHVMDIIAHRRRHPFGVLGLEATIPAMTRGYSVLRGLLAGSGLDLPELDLEEENRLLPSSLGALLPAGAVFAPHAGLDFAAALRGRWGVVQLDGDSQFDAARVAQGIAMDAAAISGTVPELVEVPVNYAGGASPMAVARELDDQARADALARELAAKAVGFDGLIAPPLLGLVRHAAVRKQLSEAVGVPVVEALAHAPSVPGVRLQQAIEAAVSGAGISMVGEIASVRTEEGRIIAGVTTDDLDISCGAAVLATGRFVSGGVTWKERCQEALLGLPVVTEEGLMEEDAPHSVVRETPMESHPLMTAGVQINSELQPMSEARVPYSNLYAAGMVIGGFASRYALCADGVALATAALAGDAATRKAGGAA